MSERVKPDWPQGQWPTAAQWAAWFITNPPDQQEQIAERVLAASQEASDCFIRNHEGLLVRNEHLTRQLLRYRTAWLSARRRLTHRPAEADA